MKLLQAILWMIRSARVAALIAGILAVVAACAIQEATPDGIAIVYNALHPQVADFEAQRHCNQFGKTAVLVETMPAPPSLETLFTRSSRSLFRCVRPAAEDEVS